MTIDKLSITVSDGEIIAEIDSEPPVSFVRKELLDAAIEWLLEDAVDSWTAEDILDVIEQRANNRAWET